MRSASVSEMGQSALSAFRFDLPLGGRQFSSIDGATIAAATLLRHAAHASSRVVREKLIRKADAVARAEIPVAVVKDGIDFDDERRPTAYGIHRLALSLCVARGELQLAAHLVESLVILAEPRSLLLGRLYCQYGLVAIRNGNVEQGERHYSMALRLGRQLREPELIGRGLIGMGGCQGAAGNIGAWRRLCERGVAECTGINPSQVAGLSQLSAALAMLGRYDEAFATMWEAYRAAGQNKRLQAFALGNLGQMLLDAGYPRAARAALSWCLANAVNFTSRQAALGGMAIACAALGDIAGIESAIAQIMSLAKTRGTPFETVSAMIESADALEMIGRRAPSATLRRRALKLATRHGYHQLVYLAENHVRRGFAGRMHPITSTSREILDLVEAMDRHGAAAVVNGV